MVITDFRRVTHSICNNAWNRSHKQGLGWQQNIGIFFLLHLKPELRYLVKLICSFTSMVFAIKELLHMNFFSQSCSSHHRTFFRILNISPHN